MTTAPLVPTANVPTATAVLHAIASKIETNLRSPQPMLRRRVAVTEKEVVATNQPRLRHLVVVTMEKEQVATMEKDTADVSLQREESAPKDAKEAAEDTLPRADEVPEKATMDEVTVPRAAKEAVDEVTVPRVHIHTEEEKAKVTSRYILPSYLGKEFIPVTSELLLLPFHV